MGLSQATVVHADCEEFLQQLDRAEVIFLDPARRDSHGGRTYGIGDCTPNVLELRDLLLQRARMVVIKLSPSSGNYAVNIKAGEWHSLTCEEADTVIMEVKEGPYVPHEIGGILVVKNEE